MKKDKSKHLKSYKLIGKNVRQKRIFVKISQEELAFRISSARNYIGCIERGEKVPSITILLDIAHALSCKLEDLVKGV